MSLVIFVMCLSVYDFCIDSGAQVGWRPSDRGHDQERYGWRVEKMLKNFEGRNEEMEPDKEAASTTPQVGFYVC